MIKSVGKGIRFLITGVILAIVVIYGILYNLSMYEDAFSWWSSLIDWFS